MDFKIVLLFNGAYIYYGLFYYIIFKEVGYIYIDMYFIFCGIVKMEFVF